MHGTLRSPAPTCSFERIHLFQNLKTDLREKTKTKTSLKYEAWKYLEPIATRAYFLGCKSNLQITFEKGVATPTQKESGQ